MPKKAKTIESTEPVVNLEEPEIREIDTSSPTVEVKPKTKPRTEVAAASSPPAEPPLVESPLKSELAALAAVVRALSSRIEALESVQNAGVEESKSDGADSFALAAVSELLSVHREEERQWVNHQILSKLQQSRR